MKKNNVSVCPVCGSEREYCGGIFVCPVCGKIPEKENENTEAALYRLMSNSDTCFARKNYNEAYLGYSSVLDADPHCAKALFRIEVTSQYLMCETSASYLGSQSFFRKVSEILTGFLEGHAENKLVLTSCRDMLEFVRYIEEYERKFALYRKTERSAAMYIRNLIDLLYYTLFLMNCIIRVNDRDSAFTAMNAYETGSEVYEKLCKGMEYYSEPDGEGNSDGKIWIREMTRLEHEKADELLAELGEIWQSILKNADDELYGELKAKEKKREEAEAVSDTETAEHDREEYENWRKNNEKEYLSADKRSIILGICSKTLFVAAAVMAFIFAAEAVVMDNVFGIFAVFTAVFAAAGVLLSVLEKVFDKRRRFYAKLVYSGAEQFQADQKDIRSVT